MLKDLLKKFPPVRTISTFLYWRKHYQQLFHNYPPGHYYSPLPDIQWVNKNKDRLFTSTDKADGVDLRTECQKNFLVELSSYFKDFSFPNDQEESFRYFCNNSMFGRSSALILFAMIRHFRPLRVVEVGSGFTSALMLDINDKFINRNMSLSFIEPYAQRLHSLLTAEDHANCKIIEKPVQDVPIAFFEQLQENDLLFIDSSHVSKVGSDVNYNLFQILPAIKPGVIIHFHDIYWPFEYPLDWINEARAWNEAYLLRAFLQYNNSFEILLFNNYLFRCFPEFYKQQTRTGGSGSSIWLRKLA